MNNKLCWVPWHEPLLEFPPNQLLKGTFLVGTCLAKERSCSEYFGHIYFKFWHWYSFDPSLSHAWQPCPVIGLFWGDVIPHINFVLDPLFDFCWCVCTFKYLPVSSIITTNQSKWTLHAQSTLKKLDYKPHNSMHRRSILLTYSCMAYRWPLCVDAVLDIWKPLVQPMYRYFSLFLSPPPFFSPPFWKHYRCVSILYYLFKLLPLTYIIFKKKLWGVQYNLPTLLP